MFHVLVEELEEGCEHYFMGVYDHRLLYYNLNYIFPVYVVVVFENDKILA